jgi:uncharacterized membrane protein
MARKNYWNGFAAGAAAGAGGALGVLVISGLLGRGGQSRIIRLDKSVQIGKPLEDCFSAWTNFERLPQMCDVIESVTSQGGRSHWAVNVDGKRLEWDAEIEQFIPNQAVGWKSIRGPKHTGRINFSRIGNDTLLHITMNYAPPTRLLRPILAPVTGQLEGFIEQAMRDFKATLEGKGQENIRSTGRITPGPVTEASRATGTFGVPGETTSGTQHTRFGGQPNPVDYTRPPDAKS